VSLESFFLGQVVVKVVSHVGVRVSLVFNVFFDGVDLVFFLFVLDFVGPDFATDIDITSFSSVNVLSVVVTVSRNSVDVSSQGSDLNILV
jgi:hypothetical protein